MKTFLRIFLLTLSAMVARTEGRASPPAPAVTVTLTRPDQESGIRSRMLVRTRLNLRAEANPGARVLVVIPATTIVMVLGCRRDWCHVRFGRYQGWVIRGGLYLP